MSPRREYDEFEIEIRSITDQSFEARVLESPVRGSMRASAPFEPPFDLKELDLQLRGWTARIAREASGTRHQRDAWIECDLAPEPPAFDPKAMGESLGNALFRDPIRDRFVESRGWLSGHAAQGFERGLRLRFAFDRKEDFAAVATPPWEFLYRDDHRLALNARTPIVRSLQRCQRIEPLRTEELRVLLVASKAGSRPLDLDREIRVIRQALEANQKGTVEVLPRADLGLLRETLSRKDFHVLHFMGHGQSPRNADSDYTLLFEGQGGSLSVDGDLLANHIRGTSPSLRLVVLNACWGGALPHHEGLNPYSGVAAQLIRREFPAVLAMQQPVADDTAIAFSSAFYESLATGATIGEAVTEGRLRMSCLSEVEWATPVLYVAANDDLFEIGPAPANDSTPRAPAIRRDDRPLLIRIQSFKNPNLATDQEPDRYLDLSQHFSGHEDRFIEDQSLWQNLIFPTLEQFLRQFRGMRRPLLFDFAAHATLAYASGYVLENQSGLDITLLQKSRGVQPWHSGPIQPISEPLWQDDLHLPRQADCNEVALALSVTWVDIHDDVKNYLDQSRTKVGRLLSVAVPNPGSNSVRDAAHVLQLADSLARKIRKRTYDERESVLHLFASAPNSFLFFLGQHRKGLGTVQLYEHAPEGKKPRRPDEPETEKPLRYEPSLRLPLD